MARAAAAHPAVHAYRNWRGQLVTHRHVDVGTMVEIPAPQGPFALPHVLRDADIRGVPDLTAELHHIRRDPSASSSGRWLERAWPAATRIPGMVPAMYAVMARSVAARQRIGTVAVTAVGMFAGGGGFGITSLSLMSLEVIVGGMSQRPRVVDGQVTVRDLLDLTVVIDHNVVDGAPAAASPPSSGNFCRAPPWYRLPALPDQPWALGPGLLFRRYRRGRPDPFRTVRDIGRVTAITAASPGPP